MTVDDRATLALVMSLASLALALWGAFGERAWDRFQARRFRRRVAKRGGWNR